jgi:hypothetical protein
MYVDECHIDMRYPNIHFFLNYLGEIVKVLIEPSGER